MQRLRPAPRPLLLAGLLLAAGIACRPPEEGRQALKAEVQAHLDAYLPALARAYTTGDVSGLTGLAAEKEIASVQKRIGDLRLEGRILEPTFRDVTVEGIHDWNYANAFVTTVETWDLRLLAAGSEEVISEQLDQHQRVKYQLKRDGRGWLVLFRAIQP